MSFKFCFTHIFSLIFLIGTAFRVADVKAQSVETKPDSLKKKGKMTVHFMVDMRGAMAKVKIPTSIGIRGNAAPLSWERTYHISDPDQNGVYEAVITFENATPGFMLEYKYVHDQSHWETIGNRSLLMKIPETFLPLEKWNVAPRSSDKKKFEALSIKTLYKTIVELDSTLFLTIYTCNPQQNRKFFTEDMEFYHDKTGITKGRQAFMESLEKNYCQEKKPYRTVRKLVKNTMKVFPLQDFGAVQTGQHRFYKVEDGQKDKPMESARFTHIWQLEKGEWKISRVISYDHQPIRAAITQ